MTDREELHPEDLPQSLLGEHAGRLSDGDQFAPPQQGHPIADLRRLGEIVEDTDHRSPLVRMLAGESQGQVLVGQIEVCGGLVEDPDRRFLDEDPRQENPAPLPAGQGRDRTPDEGGGLQPLEGPRDPLPIRRAVQTKGTQMRGAAHQDHFLRVEGQVDGELLGKMGDLPGDGLSGERANRLRPEPHPTSRRWNQSSESPGQRALSRPVGADQTEDLPGMHLEVDAPEGLDPTLDHLEITTGEAAHWLDPTPGSPESSQKRTPLAIPVAAATP